MTRAKGPYMEVARIQSEINRLFEHLTKLREGGSESSEGAWTPSVDVAEAPEFVVVHGELPGIDPASIEIVAQEGNLLLRGARHSRLQAEGDDRDVLLDEREFGNFERVIPLGVAVNPHKAVARYVDGVLTIRLPRVPNRRGEPVPIHLER